MGVVTVHAGPSVMSFDDDVLADPNLTRTQAVAHAMGTDVANVHEVPLVGTPHDLLLVIKSEHGWRVAPAEVGVAARWAQADVDARVLDLMSLAGYADFAPDLLGLAATWCANFGRVQAKKIEAESKLEMAAGLERPFAQVNLDMVAPAVRTTQTITVALLRFWLSQEQAAGVGVEGAQMLVALSSEDALYRFGPELLDW